MQQQQSQSSSSLHGATVAYCLKACALVARTIRSSQSNPKHDESSESNSVDPKSSNAQRDFLLSVAQELCKYHPGCINRDDQQLVLDPNPEGAAFVNAPNTTTNSSEVRLPCCRCCGIGLQPGYNGTRVHLKSQRKKKRQRKPNASVTISQGKSCPPKVTDGSLDTWKNNEGIRSFQDCRNFLVLTCSLCQTKCRVPGLPRRKRNSAEPSSQNNKNNTQKVGTDASSTIPSSQPVAFEEAVKCGLDFVPLSEKPLSPPATKAAAAYKRKQDSSSSSLLPPQNQFKKQKKKRQPSSKLRDFLSSLND